MSSIPACSHAMGRSPLRLATRRIRRLERFPTYRATADLDPRFFEAWVMQREVWELAGSMSTGTTAGSRSRLSETDFLQMESISPPEAQRRVGVTVDALKTLRNGGARASNLAVALRDALL